MCTDNMINELFWYVIFKSFHLVYLDSSSLINQCLLFKLFLKYIYSNYYKCVHGDWNIPPILHLLHAVKVDELLITRLYSILIV